MLKDSLIKITALLYVLVWLPPTLAFIVIHPNHNYNFYIYIYIHFFQLLTQFNYMYIYNYHQLLLLKQTFFFLNKIRLNYQ